MALTTLWKSLTMQSSQHQNHPESYDTHIQFVNFVIVRKIHFLTCSSKGQQISEGINEVCNRFSQNMNKKLSGFLPCVYYMYTGQKSI